MEKIKLSGKKPYAQPALHLYGQICDMTGHVGMGALNDGGPGASGMAKTA